MNQIPARPVVHLVDDDVSLLRALKRLLTLAGHEVLTFSSAAEFFKRPKPTSRGCVVVDLRMPGCNGLELQASLAAESNPLPVIFLTGHGSIATSVHAMKRGAEDFLTKPVKKEDLLDAVERALARDAEASGRRETQGELLKRFARLTLREREVLEQIIAGKLNKEIAYDLGASERTIKAHRSSIMKKLEAHSPAELGGIARELGHLAGVQRPI